MNHVNCPWCNWRAYTVVPDISVGGYKPQPWWLSFKFGMHAALEHDTKIEMLQIGYPEQVFDFADANEHLDKDVLLNLTGDK